MRRRGLAAALFYAAINSAAATELKPWTDGAKPAFSLESLDHRRTELGDQIGRVVLVHFFATWCEPCRAEIAALQRLANRFAKQPVTILAVDVAEVQPRVRRFFDAQPVSFPVLLDLNRTVTKAWKVDVLPTTFILDRTLMPRFVVEADFDWDRLDAVNTLDALLTSPSGMNATNIQTVFQGRKS